MLDQEISIWCIWLHRILIVFHSLLATSIALGVIFFLMLQDVWKALPDIQNPQALLAEQSISIVDRFGNELYRVVQEEDRAEIDLDLVPLHVRQAFIAIEDERFFERSCIDVRALSRAVWMNVNEYKSQGASTITQQLVRTVFLTPEKTLLRKVRELMLACQLESLHTKEEILDLYLNWISFGQNIYGIEQASKRFFGVEVSDLTLAQASVLASLPQRPTYFSPYGPHLRTTVSDELREKIRKKKIVDPKDIDSEDITIGLLGTRTRIAKEPYLMPGRANIVLLKMVEAKFISKEEKKAAERDLLQIAFLPDIDFITAPHFVLWVRDQIPKLLSGVDEATIVYSGIKVHTTLDPFLQRIAESSVAKMYSYIRYTYGAKNISMLAVDLKTNEIRAYIGNWNYFDEYDEGKIDMVQAPRQPGSSFKPFVYAAAFKNGYTPDTYVRDEPIRIGPYRPRNYEGGYFGRMKIRDALARSRNIPAIKAYYWGGEEKEILKLAYELGITDPIEYKRKQDSSFEYGWPLALGSAEVPLIQMAQGYSTIARNGVNSPLIAIKSITKDEGQLYAPLHTSSQAIDPKIAQDLTSILSNVGARPEGYWRDSLTLSTSDAAVKTGTSSMCMLMTEEGKCLALYAKDTWVIGYTPELLVAVWVGNADNTPLSEEANGLTAAVPLWKDFLMQLHTTTPPNRTKFDT